MPDPLDLSVVYSDHGDGIARYWTGELVGNLPTCSKDRAKAYALMDHGARDVAARFAVSLPYGVRWTSERLIPR